LVLFDNQSAVASNRYELSLVLRFKLVSEPSIEPLVLVCALL
jgi:hypothetical protein